jgi:antitoxin FitA
MGAIQVKNVPADLHEALRRRAADEGMDLQDYVLMLIRRDLRRPTMREWLEEAIAPRGSEPSLRCGCDSRAA